MFVKVIDYDICGGAPYINWFHCDTDKYDLVESVITDACDMVFHIDNEFNEHRGLGFGEVEDMVTSKLKEFGIKGEWFDADLEIEI